MQDDMVFANLVRAIFCGYFSSGSIKNAEKNICGSRESKPQKGHFDEGVGRVLKKFNASFGGFGGQGLGLKLCSGHDK